MVRRSDLLVIGTGTGGTTVAQRCRKAGWSVAIADERPYGGTCQLRGCDPKKVLVGVADALDAVHRLSGWGIEPGGARITWSELMRFKRSFTDPVSREKQAAFRSGDVEVRQEHTGGWYSSRRVRESASGYKVILQRSTGRILGAHVLGHGAEELINQFALAMRGGLTAQALEDTILSYPSLGSDLQHMV